MFLYLQTLFVKKLVKSKILVYNIWWFAIGFNSRKLQNKGSAAEAEACAEVRFTIEATDI